MGEEGVQSADFLQNFRAVVEVYLDYPYAASNGSGFERRFFGLASRPGYPRHTPLLLLYRPHTQLDFRSFLSHPENNYNTPLFNVGRS
jgi:hypothetical protein